jgi:membrane protein required for colicin V production
LSWVDYVLVAICVASAAFGFWRGFVKEAIALVTWVAAIGLAWYAAWMIEPRLGEWSAAPELRIWAARALIFVGVLLIGGLIAWSLRAVIRKTGLSGTDRTLGALFGLARGILFLGLFALFIGLADLDSEVWWTEARFRPFSERVADGILYYADLGGSYLEDGQNPIEDIL